MTPRPRPSAAVPAGTTSRQGPAPGRRGRAGGVHRSGRSRRDGVAGLALVAGLAFLVGVGVGVDAVVRPAEPSATTSEDVTPVASGSGAASDDGPPGEGTGTAAGRSATRGAPPAAVGPDGGGSSGAVGAADGGAGAAEGGAGTVAADVGAGADPGADTGTAELEAAAADVRPLPLPQLVPRDTTGPLWLTPADRGAGLLALDVPEAASGVLDVVPGSAPAPGTVGVRSVRVEVERGLAVDGAVFAATVMETLNAPRGWGARGDLSFARTDGPADLRVVLASPALVDALCAPLATAGQFSCGRNGHAALNVRRWVQATDEFADRTLYRQYLVNHEVGHLLGHPHERCPGPGRPAPLMQQQSIRVAPCLPNGWPY